MSANGRATWTNDNLELVRSLATGMFWNGSDLNYSSASNEKVITAGKQVRIYFQIICLHANYQESSLRNYFHISGTWNV